MFKLMKYRTLYHKPTIIAIAIVALFVGAFSTVFVSAKYYVPQKIKLGVFDPEGLAQNTANINWQKDFAAWTDPAELLQNKVQAAVQNNRVPLLTLEPWPVSTDPAQRGDAFLTKVTAGAYDPQINTSCVALAGNGEVLVRWGHEMELANNRYPWSGTTPQTYVGAYKHFIDLCRKLAPTVRFVWSPAGDVGSEQYWPGSSYVDYIGISVYSSEAWELANGGVRRSFIEIAKPKLSRMAKFNRPIIVAEMGVTGTDSYKASWLSAIKVRDLRSPNLIGLVYFNSKDVEGAWGVGQTTPDWRLSPAGLLAFSALAVK
jgi:endoglucanase